MKKKTFSKAFEYDSNFDVKIIKHKGCSLLINKNVSEQVFY